MTHDRQMLVRLGSNPLKGSHCFTELETLPLILSTGWFQERIRA